MTLTTLGSTSTQAKVCGLHQLLDSRGLVFPRYLLSSILGFKGGRGNDFQRKRGFNFRAEFILSLPLVTR
jgi:hypothetical protein